MTFLGQIIQDLVLTISKNKEQKISTLQGNIRSFNQKFPTAKILKSRPLIQDQDHTRIKYQLRGRQRKSLKV
jgi:hypothetical protein